MYTATNYYLILGFTVTVASNQYTGQANPPQPSKCCCVSTVCLRIGLCILGPFIFTALLVPRLVGKQPDGNVKDETDLLDASGSVPGVHVFVGIYKRWLVSLARIWCSTTGHEVLQPLVFLSLTILLVLSRTLPWNASVGDDQLDYPEPPQYSIPS
jgi:hypothetical protein